MNFHRHKQIYTYILSAKVVTHWNVRAEPERGNVDWNVCMNRLRHGALFNIALLPSVQRTVYIKEHDVIIIYYYAKMQHIKIQYKSTHKTHIYTPNYLAEKNLATITRNVNKMCPHTILNNMCTEVDRWYMIFR